MNTYEIIKQLRQQMHMSQDELAKKTGYSDRSSIAKIEAGKVDLSESKISLFASALNVSPAQLMGISEDTSAPAMELTPEEAQLVDDYRDASPEIRGAAAVMLHTSAEANRKDGSSSVSNAG